LIESCFSLFHIQIVFEGRQAKKNVYSDQEHRSFGWGYFLELKIQNVEAGRSGYIHAYFNYFKYIYYCNYCNYCDYFQVRGDLGIADRVWADKRADIVKQVDDLGDQFCPAM
jgi:hypothetical protein